jgi:presenilin-like A22 family membrane protease
VAPKDFSGGDVKGLATMTIKKRKEGDILPVLSMLVIFMVTILFAAATTTILPNDYKVFGEENSEDLANPLFYIVIIIVFTGFILFLAKIGKEKFIQGIILAAVSISIVYVFYPPFLILLGDSPNDPSPIGATIAVSTAILIAYVMTILLVVYPEWYIVDATGIFLSIGITAILGFSMGILPLLLLLTILAIYDAISVYQTKHMVALADSVVEQRLPILLVIPKEKEYTFLEQKGLKKQLESGEEREAMFMGLGDIIIPGSLVVSAFVYVERSVIFTLGGISIGANLLVAIGTLIGSMIGFSALMYFVMKGNPQAGLPLLNSGAILGYLLTAFLVLGNLGLSMPHLF